LEEDAVSFDRLLLWLSAKGEGSWSQFRGAVEEFHAQPGDLEPDFEDGQLAGAGSDLPIYQQVRFALQRLGHIEFYTAGAEKGWRVVPPTVAIGTRATAEGVLCGARAPVLLDRLFEDNELTVHASQIDGMPRRIVARSESCELLIARMRELGFKVQKDAPGSLLSALPRVRDPSYWRASMMPETPGWLVHRFSTYPKPQWKEVPQAGAQKAPSGLFRFVMKHQRFYYLRWRGSTYRVPVQVGKYAVLGRRRRTLRYDPERHTLSVPVAFRPPLLMERALVLCSGVLPRYDVSTGRLQYTDVRHEVALLAAQLLCQEVR
jgi:hypothetical protein